MAVLTEFGRSQDGYVRSAYFHKDRGGKLIAGPLWDYDLTFGVSCCFNSHLTGIDPATGSGWQYNNGYNRGARENGLADNAHGSTMARLDWTRLMMADPAFRQRFTDSYQSLRRGPLSNSAFAARIDALAAQLSNNNNATDSPQRRNFLKWGTLGSATTGFQTFLPLNLRNASETWAAHVDYVKSWAAQRTTWMDSQFIPMPISSTPQGFVLQGTSVALTATNDIYVTLDGSDPRLPDGSPSPSATLLPPVPGGPPPSILISSTAHVVARSRNTTGSAWSAPLHLWYLVGNPATPVSLIVSELHYHPADPSPAEQLPDNSLTTPSPTATSNSSNSATSAPPPSTSPAHPSPTASPSPSPKARPSSPATSSSSSPILSPSPAATAPPPPSPANTRAASTTPAIVSNSATRSATPSSPSHGATHGTRQPTAPASPWSHVSPPIPRPTATLTSPPHGPSARNKAVPQAPSPKASPSPNPAGVTPTSLPPKPPQVVSPPNSMTRTATGSPISSNTPAPPTRVSPRPTRTSPPPLSPPPSAIPSSPSASVAPSESSMSPIPPSSPQTPIHGTPTASSPPNLSPTPTAPNPSSSPSPHPSAPHQPASPDSGSPPLPDIFSGTPPPH